MPKRTAAYLVVGHSSGTRPKVKIRADQISRLQAIKDEYNISKLDHEATQSQLEKELVEAGRSRSSSRARLLILKVFAKNGTRAVLLFCLYEPISKSRTIW